MVRNSTESPEREIGKAKSVGSRTEETVSALGEKITGLADTIRDSAGGQGVMAGAADEVASAIETGGMYLQEAEIGHFLDEAAELMRRHPVQSVLIGIAAGYILSRAFSS